MYFTLPLPPSTNEAYRSGRFGWYKSDKEKEWEEEVFILIKQQWMKQGREKFGKNATVVFIKYMLKRDRDVDGSHKGLLDLLADVGIYDDDKYVVESRQRKYKVKKGEKPQCVVTIEEDKI